MNSINSQEVSSLNSRYRSSLNQPTKQTKTSQRILDNLNNRSNLRNRRASNQSDLTDSTHQLFKDSNKTDQGKYSKMTLSLMMKIKSNKEQKEASKEVHGSHPKRETRHLLHQTMLLFTSLMTKTLNNKVLPPLLVSH